MSNWIYRTTKGLCLLLGLALWLAGALPATNAAGCWDVTLTDCFSPEAATRAALTVE